MKKIYFFFILIPCICNSQVKIDAFDEDKKSSDSPSILNYDTAHAYKSFDENLRISAIMMPTQWSLFYEHNEDKYSPHKNSEISDAITTSKKISGLNQQYAKYAALIFKELDLIGDELGVFISNNDRLPFSIYKFPIDNQNLLFIDGATSDDVFNILKLTSKQRSARIVSSKLLPALKMISDQLNIPGIKYIGLSFTYGSKDFSNDENVLNLKAEYLCGIFPLEKIRQYTNNEITEDDLVGFSHFYLRDRDNFTPNKVKIVIE